VSSTVSVPSLTLNVKSSKSLLIRTYYGETGNESYLLVPSNYKTSLSATDITTSDAVAVAGGFATSPYSTISTWTLNNVTAVQTGNATLDGKALNNMSLSTKEYTVSTDAASVADINGDYIDLMFWVFSQTADEAIVLENLSITTGTSSAYQAIAVAVWKAQNGASTVSESAKIFSQYPDYDFEFTVGMEGYNTPATPINAIADPSVLLALHSTFYQDGSTPAANIVTDNITNATTLTTLSLNTPSLMVVRIYIEGWDAQTTNSILAGTFNISFSFSLKNQS